MKKSKKLKITLLSLQGIALILTALSLYQAVGLYDFFSSKIIISFAFCSLFLSANVCTTFYPFLKATRFSDRKFMRFLWIYALSAFAALTAFFSWFLYELLGKNLSIIVLFVFVSFYGFVAYYIAFHFTKIPKKSLIYAFLAPLLLAGIVFITIYLFAKFLFNFGGMSNADTLTSNSGGGNSPIDMSGKASHIEHEGIHTYLIKNDGLKIQLYTWSSAYGEATDYADNKYIGLKYLREVYK